MNDDALLPEWDMAHPSRMAALDARLQEVMLMHVTGDPRWARTLTGVADDLVSFDQVPEMLSSVCKFVTNTVVYAYGAQEAVDLFTTDLQRLRTIANKEAQES